MSWSGNHHWHHDPLTRNLTFEPFCAYLKQVVTIHQGMFEKLLFQQQQAIPHQLSQLFADAGQTYREIARELSEYHNSSDAMLNNILKPES